MSKAYQRFFAVALNIKGIYTVYILCIHSEDINGDMFVVVFSLNVFNGYRCISLMVVGFDGLLHK